ncbi:MAG: hypothetical protein R2812_09720 [Gelidibacter sp.]
MTHNLRFNSKRPTSIGTTTPLELCDDHNPGDEMEAFTLEKPMPRFSMDKQASH